MTRLTTFILALTPVGLIFLGQFAHAVLRTAAVQAIAKDRAWASVAAVVIGQAAGDWVSMRYGAKVIGS